MDGGVAQFRRDGLSKRPMLFPAIGALFSAIIGAKKGIDITQLFRREIRD